MRVFVSSVNMDVSVRLCMPTCMASFKSGLGPRLTQVQARVHEEAKRMAYARMHGSGAAATSGAQLTSGVSASAAAGPGGSVAQQWTQGMGMKRAPARAQLTSAFSLQQSTVLRSPPGQAAGHQQLPTAHLQIPTGFAPLRFVNGIVQPVASGTAQRPVPHGASGAFGGTLQRGGMYQGGQHGLQHRGQHGSQQGVDLGGQYGLQHLGQQGLQHGLSQPHRQQLMSQSDRSTPLRAGDVGTQQRTGHASFQPLGWSGSSGLSGHTPMPHPLDPGTGEASGAMPTQLSSRGVFGLPPPLRGAGEVPSLHALDLGGPTRGSNGASTFGSTRRTTDAASPMPALDLGGTTGGGSPMPALDLGGTSPAADGKPPLPLLELGIQPVGSVLPFTAVPSLSLQSFSGGPAAFPEGW